MHTKHLLIVAILVTALFSNCSKDNVVVDPGASNGLFTVSGKVTFKKQITVPGNASFTVIWVVSKGSPDYAYAYGNGTIDWANKTFKITFSKAPPDSALNNYTSALGMGVGLMYLSDLPGGLQREIDEKEEGTFYGAVNNADIIYIKGDPKAFTSGWPTTFKSGYNVGQGVKNPGTFDSFVPMDPANLELIISDDPDDVEIPNWT